MKVYDNNIKGQSLLLILICLCSFIYESQCSNTWNKLNKFSNEINTLDHSKSSPSEILRFTETDNSLEKKLKLDISENDPLKYLALKQEVLRLYSNKKTDNDISRFKQMQVQTKHDENQIKPYEIGRIGNPTQKVTTRDEEIVQITSVTADSTYIQYNNNKEVINKFDATGVLDSNKFWCSAGNHDVKDEVKFFVEFKKSYSLTAMWVQWAFAPGEFRIKYSNDKKQWDDLLGGYRLSIKNGDVNWWRSILLNPSTRWKYKSFDERINFDEPFYARYLEISMRIPVNQFFGIFSVEFYTKSKSLVMLKSKAVGLSSCLSVANGMMTNHSPVLGLNCLQAISYGDNRDLWLLNSNGYITTHKGNKCLQSPTADVVNIIDCGTASDYKDDREKWIIEYDGKIRSMKEQFTCLTIVDHSFGDSLLQSELKVTATSKESSGNHDPDNALDPNTETYWASDPSLQDVILEIYFNKYSTFVKRMTIDWKFPAKSFKVIGMLSDGYWKIFFNSNDNRETKIDVNLNNYDLLGIKIVMRESTTKYDQKNIYGISNISIHTGASSLRREPCTQILGSGNLWELIYVNDVEDVTGQEYKKAWAELHVTRNRFDTLKNLYMKLPESLMLMKQNAVDIDKRILKLQSVFDDLDKRLHRYDEIFKKNEMQVYTLAVNQYFPAYDCAHIIKSSPNKRSGYYWIKNECMVKPLRVYCDFDLYDKKAGLDYYIFNENQSVNNVMTNIKQFKDVRLACNKLGLEPLDVKNYKMLRLIIKILKANNFNFNSESSAFIPIGYDYSCDHASCSKLYRPFNSEKSSDMNDIFSILSKDENSSLMSNLFSSSEIDDDSMKNTAGIAANYKIKYGLLAKQKVVAVVCSTNKDGSKVGTGYINLDCDSNIRGDTYRKLETFSHLRFICPRDCALSKAKVYGSNIYTDNSSICKAAVHSGVIKDAEGGIVELGVEPGRSNYIGSSAHGIETIDYVDKWDRSFTVAKYHPYCPIEKIKNYAQAMGVRFSSFLSVSESEMESMKTNLVDQINKMIKKDNNKSNTAQKLLLASELIKFIQKNELENGINVKNRNVNQIEQNNLPAISTQPTEQFTTEEALVSITAINNKDVKAINLYIKIANTFKSLIGKSANQLQILLTDKHIGLNSLEVKFNHYDSKMESYKRIIYDIDLKSQMQLKKAEHESQQLAMNLSKDSLRENFQEDYNSASILDNYKIFNSKKGNGQAAKWEYYMHNLDGHFKTIKQTGEFIDNRTGSHLIVKSRDFYDFEIKFSVLIKGSNTFGICFRYADSFNYYIFEISNQGKGFKRLRKFLKGEPQTIDIKYDGGYIQNTWYHFKIDGQQSRFKIYMTTDSTPSLRDHYDLVFEFTDNELVHGTFAFASYGLSSLMLDNISIIHMSCTEDNKNSVSAGVFTPDCPRYAEPLQSLFKYMWQKVDPLESINGPSNWIIMKKVDGRRRVLAQTSLLKGISQHEEGTILYLNQENKVCSVGKISIKFKAVDNGIVGIIFRYEKNRINYYIIEIAGGSSPSDKFVRLRRKVGSVYTLLSVRQLLGYTKNEWMRVVILMNENKFNAYISDENGLEGNLLKVFDNDIFDNELKLGLIGLSTYNTGAFFDDISLGSIEDGRPVLDINNLENVDSKLFVEKEKLPLPKSKIPTKMFERLNLHISNYSWGKCVKYASPEEKSKLCELIFKSPIEIRKCNRSFCSSCCERNTDSTNKHYRYLCEKQCNMLDDVNEENKNWKNCFEPIHPEKSIYPFCESIFNKKYFQSSRCKVDMCNLCCTSFDFTTKSKISKLNLQSCYKGCVKTFDGRPE